MQRNFLPDFVGIAMTKSQFCFCTGCTPYRLKRLFKEKKAKYERLGVHQYDKLLMPATIREILSDTGLQIDLDYYAQYVAGQRGWRTDVESH